MHNIYRWRS